MTLVRKVLILCLVAMLSLSAVAFAETEAIDPVSGAVINDSLEEVYKEHFDAICAQYADELTAQEKNAAIEVFDAIGQIHFESEDSLAVRQRVYQISSAEELKAVLTGYFDAHDASYNSDAALDAKIQEIFTACGLNLDDYYMTVTRNVGGIPDPVTTTNWYCSFVKKESSEDEETSVAMRIVLYDEDMKVGIFSMNADLW